MEAKPARKKYYTTDQEKLARYAKALSHPVRVFVMDFLANNLDKCCYSGDMAEELAQSLERVGATHAASLFREAFAFFPDSRVPATLDARVECLRKAKGVDPFKRLTQRFYSEAEKEEIVLRAFFARNPEHFGLPKHET